MPIAPPLSSSTRQRLLDLMLSAMMTPIGIRVPVSDPGKAIRELDSARRASGEVDLLSLEFLRSPFLPNSEIWLVKRSPEDQDAAQASNLEPLPIDIKTD